MKKSLGLITASILSLTAPPATALRCEAVFTGAPIQPAGVTLKSEILHRLEVDRLEVQEFLAKIVAKHHATTYTPKEQALLKEVDVQIQQLLKNNDYELRIVQGLPRALGPQVQELARKLLSIEKLRVQFASESSEVMMAFLMHPNASAWEMNISFESFNHALMHMTSAAGKSPTEQSLLAQSMLSLSEGVYYMKARQKEAQGMADRIGLHRSNLKAQKEQAVQGVLADLGWSKADVDVFTKHFAVMKDSEQGPLFHDAFSALKNYIKSHPDRFYFSENANDALYKIHRETDDGMRVYLLATAVGKTTVPQKNIESLAEILNLETWYKSLSGKNYRLLQAKKELKDLL